MAAHTRLDFTPPEHCAILRDLKFFLPSTRDAERLWHEGPNTVPKLISVPTSV